MKRQIINKEILRNYLDHHTIDEQFLLYLEKHKAAQITVDNLTEVNVMYRAQQLNTKKKSTKQTTESISSFQYKNIVLWKKGELKFFAWVVLFYCYSSKISLQQMKLKDFEFIQSIFINHTVVHIQFEIRCLFGLNCSNKKPWSQWQSKLLKKIIIQHQKTQDRLEWKSISFELFNCSEYKCCRGLKCCRQMWVNHLNPDVNRCQWTRKEEIFLFKLISKHGYLWSKIAKEFNGSRTEHMIKNKYISLLAKQRKLFPKKSTQQLQMKFIQTHSKINDEQTQNFAVNDQCLQYGSKNIEKQQSQQKQINMEPESKIKFDLLCQDKDSYTDIPYSVFEKTQWINEEQGFNFEYVKLDYRKEELKDVIDEVLPLLGCSYPEQLSFFFEEDYPSYDGQPWLNSYSY